MAFRRIIGGFVSLDLIVCALVVAPLPGRNLLDKDYFELLSAAPGGSGLYVGLPGEPRTVGVTLWMAFRSK